MKKFFSKYDAESIVASVLVGLCACLVGACIGSTYLVAGGFAIIWLVPFLITMALC